MRPTFECLICGWSGGPLPTLAVSTRPLPKTNRTLAVLDNTLLEPMLARLRRRAVRFGIPEPDDAAQAAITHALAALCNCAEPVTNPYAYIETCARRFMASRLLQRRTERPVTDPATTAAANALIGRWIEGTVVSDQSDNPRPAAGWSVFTPVPKRIRVPRASHRHPYLQLLLTLSTWAYDIWSESSGRDLHELYIDYLYAYDRITTIQQKRERQLVLLLFSGLPQARIADRLSVSKGYVSRISTKWMRIFGWTRDNIIAYQLLSILWRVHDLHLDAGLGFGTFRELLRTDPVVTTRISTLNDEHVEELRQVAENVEDQDLAWNVNIADDSGKLLPLIGL